MFRQPRNLAQARAAWRLVNNVPASDRPCWQVRNEDGRTRLYVTDVIGGWDMDAGEFVRAVHALDTDTVDVHLNSPGGFVYDAVSMYEALTASPATVHMHIDGLAASAASFLAQAGDTVEIAEAGRMMMHDAQMVAIGSPADLREAADLGDSVSDDIAGIYARRAGGKAADWRAAMRATSWYSASEAVDAKLADRISGRDKKTSGVANLAGRTLRARVAVSLGGVE